MSIRVLLTDDHPVMRAGLRTILESEPGLEIVAEAENGRQAVDLAAELKPDVVVMDVEMPVLNGMEATRRITAQNPQIKVVALSIHCDKEYVQAMSAAGAIGFVNKDSDGDELLEAIRLAAQNHQYLTPKMAAVAHLVPNR